MSRWSAHARNPVVRPGQLNPPYDSKLAGGACVIAVGDLLRLYYWGGGADGLNYICMAEAGAGNDQQWRGFGAVLSRQADNPFNSTGPAAPMVVPVTDKRWLMYVVGKGVMPRRGYLNDVILCAESTDAGWTWNYLGREPVIPRDRPYDQDGTASMFVMYEAGRFRMWYTAFQYRPAAEAAWMERVVHGRPPGRIPYLGIAYAESADGLTWSKPVAQLVVRPREDRVKPVEHWVAKPWIVRLAAADYRLWVCCIGTTYRIHALRSRDGVAWSWEQPAGEPDLNVGAPGAFDDAMVGYPCVLRIGDELHCWYTGNGYGAAGIGHVVRSL
ncbi:MAG: hypothetical protein PCFJNLEI_01112 [Verrucomicrobiae bacterium]|nr:hypothetical protein [Verrucomicrobiae bacterium]